MAKLPGIQYTGVESLGREDPYGPMRVNRAEQRALQSIGAGIEQIGDYMNALQVEEGHNKAAEAATHLLREDAKIRTNPNIDERQDQLEAAAAEVATVYRSDLSRNATRAFEEKYIEFVRRSTDKMAIDNIGEKNEVERKKTITSASDMAYMGHGDAAKNRINASQLLSESEKEEAVALMQTQFELGLVDRTILNGTPEEILRIRDGIKAETYGGALQGRQRTGAIMALDQAYKNSQSERLALEAKQREYRASNLELAIHNDQAGPQHIEQAFIDDDITGPKRTQLMLTWQKRQADKMLTSDSVALVENSITSGIGLDNRNPDHQDAVDRWYDEIQKEYAGDPKSMAAQAVNAAGRTNILPSKVESILHVTAMSGSDAMVKQTAELYEALEREAPQTLSRIGTESKAVYKSALMFVRGGTPVEDAVANARENAYKPSGEKEILRQEYASQIAPSIETHKKTMQKWMNQQNDHFDVSWGPTGAPEPTNAHYASYRALESEYYTLTGNEEQARTLARDDFMRLFSTSGINGQNEVMAFAPEREFTNLIKNTDNVDILQEDINVFYRKHDLDPDKAFIMSDAVTARGEPGDRTYAVYSVDEYGLPRKEPLRWTPDVKSIEERYIGRVKELDKSKKQLSDMMREYHMYGADNEF